MCTAKMEILINLDQSFKILHNNYQLMSEKFKKYGFQQSSQYNGVNFEDSEILKTDFGKHVNDFMGILQFVDTVREQLSAEVLQWERKLKLEHYDTPRAKEALEQIEKRFNDFWKMVGYLSIHYHAIKSLYDELPCLAELNIDFDDLAKRIRKILSRIMNSSFVVVAQPQKVIKFGNKIFSTVQHLLGEALGLTKFTPAVTMMAISAQDAFDFQTKGTISKHPCGDIKSFQSKLHLDKSSQKYMASFLNSRLMGLQRNSRRSEQSVTDEKFYFAFVVTLPIPGWQGEVTSLCCLSNPVVGIVHDSQRPSSLATIVWDNVLCETGGSPTDSVPWHCLCDHMNKIFLKETSTNLPLSQENMDFLCHKLFLKTPPCTYESFNLVTWRRFSKEHMHNLKFTFWKWFYSTMKLIKEHLKTEWNNKCIIGYISKEDAHRKLRTCQPGTFLLRFSDSIEEGAISVARSVDNGVEHLEPSNSEDLRSRSLNDRLVDLQSLKYIYPNIPKDEQFRVKEKPVKDGYKPTPLKVADTTPSTSPYSDFSPPMDLDEMTFGSSYLYFNNNNNNNNNEFDHEISSSGMSTDSGFRDCLVLPSFSSSFVSHSPNQE